MTTKISDLSNADNNDIKNEDYIAALETKVAHLDKLLTISEAQKDHLKKQVKELQEKIAEFIRNSGKSP